MQKSSKWKRRRLIARIDRASPAVLVTLFSAAIVGFVMMAWTELAEGTQPVKRFSGALALPEKATPELIALGDSLFHGSTSPGFCAVCHGEKGKGTALGPRLAGSRSVAGDGSLDSIARVIRVGVYWLPTTRLPSMPSYDRVFDREQIWALAAYVRSISRGNW